MTTELKKYLTAVETDLKAGVATEHTYRPALAMLLHTYPGIRAINEPTRIACGAPDFAVLKDGFLVGHIEAKDIGADLNAVERSPQLKRYLDALPNLILTDYLEFRWYVAGAHRQTARLATLDRHNKLKSTAADMQAVGDLLHNFLVHTPQPIATPRELAERMAHLAHLIRDSIVVAFETGRDSNLLAGWRTAFAEVLVADLDQPARVGEFADMFAQTLAYGLFSARVMDDASHTFTRAAAQHLIPRTNPFLRDFFYQITGPQLESEPFAGFVEDLVQLLACADMGAILADFGRRTRQQDPTVHFYETFLAAYDPALREKRGVFYTPDPVVSFIVRSVDQLLKRTFGLPQGLADTTKVTVKNTDPGLRVKGKDAQVRKTAEVHKVLILDPATGTATFPYAIVDHIRAQFMAQGNAGMWSGYVREHLLPRIFGFELLMAPYAVAHFKLALQLAGHDLDPEQRAAWAYDFSSDERIGIYLTNALEGPHEHTGLPLFTQFLADESAAANEIKRDAPIMVVVGNPPYAVSSSNQGPHIEELMALYKTAVRSERNIQPLSDDYIKFIRFAHDRIARTGYGILGFITNHSYLAGLIHRGMREELLKSFDEIYILNLHGNALLRETAPDGGKDENVFDIRQGVAIALMVKTGKGDGLATVHYADLWGERESKYRALNENDVTTLSWETLQPATPHYFFVPKDFDLSAEYKQSWALVTIFGTGDSNADQGKRWGSGIKTNRDALLIGFDLSELENRIGILATLDISDDEVRQRVGLKDGPYWNTHRERNKIREVEWKKNIVKCLYRPFDSRWLLYQPNLIEIGRGGASKSVMRHFMLENFAILCKRQTKRTPFSYVLISSQITESCVFESAYANNSVFPLYLYPEATSDAGTLFSATALSPWPPDPAHGNRVPNLSPDFVKAAAAALGLPFTPIQPTPPNSHPATFGPEDLLAYLYAVLHSPTYRERYAEFLKIDFPRVPLTADVALFWRLVALGRELIALHLLESPAVVQFITSYPVPGDNEVAPKGSYPQYTPPNPAQGLGGRVHINAAQYFEGVPEAVWDFQIGGYQVLHKWLKDRRGRQLTFDDLLHYQKVVVALQETMRLMAEVDAVIEGHGGWPIG